MDKEAQEKIVEVGMYYSDRCQFCHDFGEKIEPYLCPECIEKIIKLGYRKPLDSLKVREKINPICHNLLGKYLGKDLSVKQFNEYVNQIIALIIPKDKPPLLTPQARTRIRENWLRTKLQSYDVLIERTAQAQREADIKHYEGRLKNDAKSI